MSMTRYYKVTDQSIIDGLEAHRVKTLAAQDKANELAVSYGFEQGHGVLRRWGIWDAHLSGFFCSRGEHSEREDREFWTIPKEGVTRPKKNKKNPNWAGFSNACKELNIESEEIDELLGFSHMTFFPTRPGVNFSPDKNLLIFLMPEKCNEVKGAEEITNIEYMEISGGDESDE